MRAVAVALSLFLSASISALDLTSHKTAGLEYPENSLDGFQYSLGLAIDTIELDLHLTQDNHLVLSHDPVLDNYNCFAKNSDERIIISQTRLKTIQSLQCVNHKLKKPYTIPTFLEILAAYRASGRQDITLNIEIKVLDKLIENWPRYQAVDVHALHFPDKTIAQAVYSELRQAQVEQNIMFTSFSRSLLLELKQQQQAHEQFTYGLLFKGEYAPIRLFIPTWYYDLDCYEFCWWADWQDAYRWMVQHNIDAFMPNWPQLTHPLFKQGFIDTFLQQDRPFVVYPWTLNTPEEWAVFKEYQQYPAPFDGIITDLPAKWLKYYQP